MGYQEEISGIHGMTTVEAGQINASFDGAYSFEARHLIGLTRLKRSEEIVAGYPPIRGSLRQLTILPNRGVCALWMTGAFFDLRF